MRIVWFAPQGGHMYIYFTEKANKSIFIEVVFSFALQIWL